METPSPALSDRRAAPRRAARVADTGPSRRPAPTRAVQPRRQASRPARETFSVCSRTAYPCGQGLPLGIVLRHPVLSALVPCRTAGLSRERIREQDALERFARNDQPRDAIEIAARLILGPGRGARRQRLEIRARAA